MPENETTTMDTLSLCYGPLVGWHVLGLICQKVPSTLHDICILETYTGCFQLLSADATLTSDVFSPLQKIGLWQEMIIARVTWENWDFLLRQAST